MKSYPVLEKMAFWNPPHRAAHTRLVTGVSDPTPPHPTPPHHTLMTFRLGFTGGAPGDS